MQICVTLLARMEYFTELSIECYFFTLKKQYGKVFKS